MSALGYRTEPAQAADTALSAHCRLLKVAARVQCTFLIATRSVVMFPPVLLFQPAVHVIPCLTTAQSGRCSVFNKSDVTHNFPVFRPSLRSEV